MYFSVDFANLQNLLQSMAPKHMQKNEQKVAAPTDKIFIKTKERFIDFHVFCNIIQLFC